jgi:hypothetical protein
MLAPQRQTREAEPKLKHLIHPSSYRAALSLTLLAATAQQPAPPTPLADAKQQLAQHHFAEARQMYDTYLHTHPGSIEAQLGLADVELGLHHYQTAELQYRALVAAQPQLWIAHKNLVIVEAALGRWSEFDRERALLHDARLRGAPGIDKHETDVIDTFDVHGKHWIVREYDDLAGRSLTRYNFEHFSPDGRVAEYISLESTQAAQQALQNHDVAVVGAEPKAPAPVADFTLNFYTGKTHGTIARYPHGEPTYETARSAVIRWLRH